MKKIYYALIFLCLQINTTTFSQETTCFDLSGLDFGNCLAVLGYGVINGDCVAISGCSSIIDDVDYQEYFFDTISDCETQCSIGCLDLLYIDFGPCEAVLGYGSINGECIIISGCSTVVNGFDFAPYIYSSSAACTLNCGPICMDLYGIDFGLCDFFMGYATINGECISLSGCGPEVDGIDYSAFIYETTAECESNCQETCLDLINLDFGECTTPLGITIINGECAMVSGCSYEVNGIDYENFFFESFEECEENCFLNDTLCVIPELIDSSMGCLTIFEPVCGCDGITYSNSCYATYYGGVAYWTDGECTVGINKNDFDKIEIFPNPASDLLTIENPDQEEISLRIIDMSGRIVLLKDLKATTTINISYIKQGIYLLHVYNGSGNFAIKKLIIK